VACNCEDLVKPTTVFVRSEDILLKLPPFNQSAFVDCRMYVFNDTILLAKRREGVGYSNGGSGKGYIGGRSGGGSLARRFKSLGKASTGYGSSGHGSFKRANGTGNADLASESPFELTHRLNLDRRTVMDKLVRPESESSDGDQKPWFGFTMTHVKRVVTQVPVTGSTSSGTGLRGWGSLKSSVSRINQQAAASKPKEISSVQKFQIRVKSEAVNCALQQCIESLVSAAQETKESASANDSGGGAIRDGEAEPGRRKWASKKGATTTKYGTGKYGMKERAAFAGGGGSGMTPIHEENKAEDRAKE
jgi:hypothetical protein